MTDMQEAAAAAISLLHEKGWSKGAATGPGGSICMAVALCDGKRFASSEAEYNMSVTRNCHAIALIRSLFPERLSSGKISDFNDHPDTTLEDVFLVLKHMTEGE